MKTSPLTSYQILLIVVFVFLLFTIVVDYMTLPALSAILLPDLQITTKQFGLVVSAYAFSAGISAFLATAIADHFDRKKLLLVYYGGFLFGIVLCAIANSLLALIIARGAFMALDSSFQQIAGGIAATAAGWIVYQAADGMIHGYPSLGWPVSGVMFITIGLMYAIHLIAIVQQCKICENLTIAFFLLQKTKNASNAARW